jgi:O-antigen/teichoic acid export membrane protein
MHSVATTTTESDPPQRSLGRTVARNTTFMLSGQVLIKILAFAFNIYVVRRLGDVYYGRYAAALAYVAVFAMFTDLGTSALSVREMARQPRTIAWMVPDIMALRMGLSVIACAALGLSAWLLGKPPDMVMAISVASVGLLLYAFQGPLDSVMIAQERLDLSSTLGLLNQLGFMLLGTVLLVSGAGYVGLLVASLGAVLMTGLISFHVTRRILGLRFERPAPSRWWSLLKASFPFGFAGVVAGFAQRFDTVFMSFVLTDTAVAWYNVPYSLIVMMLLMAQSLAISIYPTLVREYDSGRGSIQRTVQQALRYLLLLSLPMAVGGMVLADRVIALLYGQEFAPAIGVMRILVWILPPMFLSEMLGRTSSTLHLEKKAAGITVVRALIGIGVTVAVVPRFGIIGAAVVAVVIEVVRVVLASLLIGPAMLWKGSVGPLLRVVDATALMGVVVWRLRDLSFVTAMDGRIALLFLVGAGAAVYGMAALLLRAINPGEARHFYGLVRRRLCSEGRR